MVFHMPQKRIQLLLIKIAGEDIAFVDNFNFLGIIINKHLNWISHVDMFVVVLRSLVFGASMYDVTVHESRDRLE